MTVFSKFTAALALAFVPALAPALSGLTGTAQAASLGLPTEAAPILSGSGTAYNEFFGAWIFSLDGTGSSTPPAPGAGLTVSVFGDITSAPVSAPLNVLEAGPGTFLAGSLLDVGYETDKLELLYDNLSGSAAAAFGPQALLVIEGNLGSDPVNSGFGSFLFPEAVTFEILKVGTSVIPVPAALPLLGAGLLGLGLVGRRRAKAAA